jgi:hypothetical protein
MAYGMGGQLGICFQQSAGTAYYTGMKFLPFISESFNEEIPPIVAEGINGRYSEGPSYEGAHAVAGDVTFEVDPALIGYFLKGALGITSYAITTVTSFYFTHTFMPAPTDFDKYSAFTPMTIECYRDAGSAFTYYDACINTLSFEFAFGALVKCTAGVIGAGFATSAKQTASFEPFSDFIWDQTSIAVAGTAVEDMQNLTITINNKLEATSTLDGSKFPNRVKRAGKRTIEVAGTLLFVSQAEAAVYRAQTERLFSIVSKQGSNQIQMDLPSVRYTTFPVNAGGPGQIAVGFTGSAKYNIGSGTDIRFITSVVSMATY